MNIIIGIDDTDNKDSRGTGHLARMIAAHFTPDFTIHGVTRHQLLFDPRVPYTAKNSCAAIHLQAADPVELQPIFERAADLMLADFQPGSDPGLAVAVDIPQAIIEFGYQTQQEIVNRQQALDLAASHHIRLRGLGGTEDGVIGALAALGLAASGNDGRYVMTGTLRELSGEHSVAEIISAGVHAVRTQAGDLLALDAHLNADKLRPARRNGKPVLFVERSSRNWHALKLD